MTSTLAPSTQRNFDSSFRNYISFCHTKNLCALPIHEFNLMLYTTKLSQTTSCSNIKVHISSIKHFAVLYQYHQNVPPLPRLYMLIRAIKRQHGKNISTTTTFTDHSTTDVPIKILLITFNLQYLRSNNAMGSFHLCFLRLPSLI